MVVSVCGIYFSCQSVDCCCCWCLVGGGGGGEGVFNLCCETAVFGLLTCLYPFFLFFFFFLVCSFEEKEMG